VKISWRIDEMPWRFEQLVKLVKLEGELKVLCSFMNSNVVCAAFRARAQHPRIQFMHHCRAKVEHLGWSRCCYSPANLNQNRRVPGQALQKIA